MWTIDKFWGNISVSPAVVIGAFGSCSAINNLAEMWKTSPLPRRWCFGFGLLNRLMVC